METYLYEDLNKLEGNHWWHISKRRSYLALISKFVKIKNPKILDIGCGTGGSIKALSKIGSWWGVDNSSDAIKFCKSKGLKNAREGSSYKTGFKTGFFNLVTLLDLLEHTDENKTIKEVKRILKSRGFVIITVPSISWLWSRWDEVLHHKKRYSINELKALLEKNNFKVLKISYLYSFLVLPAIITRTVKNIFYKNYYPSDFKINLSIVNKFMLKLADFERYFVLKFGMPFGTSLICIAQKNEEG